MIVSGTTVTFIRVPRYFERIIMVDYLLIIFHIIHTWTTPWVVNRDVLYYYIVCGSRGLGRRRPSGPRSGLGHDGIRYDTYTARTRCSRHLAYINMDFTGWTCVTYLYNIIAGPPNWTKRPVTGTYRVQYECYNGNSRGLAAVRWIPNDSVANGPISSLDRIGIIA